MIEAGMYVALGFFAATLIGLAIMPAFYKRAVRLTREAILAVNPSSYAEVRATQDFERANHALALCRAETALDHERQTAAARRAEAGRLRLDLAEAQAELDEVTKKLDRQIRASEAAEAEAKKKAEADKARSKKAKAAPIDPAAETSAPDTGLTVGAEPAHAGTERSDVDQAAFIDLRDKLTETELALASTRAELDLLKIRLEDAPAAWHPATDTMALATITGLESQIATLQTRLAHYEKQAKAQKASSEQSADPVPAAAAPSYNAELEEAHTWSMRLENDLVDAEARFISAQAEVARLSVQLDQVHLPEDDLRETLERDLKWAENEGARLTALVRERERALERTGAKLQRLRDDLRRTPALAGLRSDLLALSKSILSGEPLATSPEIAAETPAAPPPAPSAQAPEPQGQVFANASSLLSRIVRSSLANAAPRTAPFAEATPEQSQTGQTLSESPAGDTSDVEQDTSPATSEPATTSPETEPEAARAPSDAKAKPSAGKRSKKQIVA